VATGPQGLQAWSVPLPLLLHAAALVEDEVAVQV
jgi:hypothetical protein